MPIHDWTRVDAGLFHAFHQHWIISICDALNGGRLPADFYALPEQLIPGPIPDVVTLRLGSGKEPPSTEPNGAVAVAVAPPRPRIIQTTEDDLYAGKADHIVVKHRHGQVVAVIEIVSPGNKGSKSALRTFVEKTSALIRQGINVVVIDPFPPTKRDSQGIHKAIWDEFEDVDLAVPPDKPLTLASYDAGELKTAYVEPIAVNDTLPDMPLFLNSMIYVPVPLEATYQTTWRAFPAALKPVLETA